MARGRPDHSPSLVVLVSVLASIPQDFFHPFVCPKCQAGYNEAKALVFHHKEFHKGGGFR